MEPETLNFSEDEIFYDEEDECSEISLDENIDPLDITLQEKIICIELINNNKIYLNYKTSWTLRDLLQSLYSNTKFQKFYQNTREHIFDLKLIFLRQLKNDNETKIDLDMKIDYLASLGYLKSYKYNLFKLSDSRNYDKIFKDEEFIKRTFQKIHKTKNINLIYKNYLPRCYGIHQQQILDYYMSNKRGINVLSKLTFDSIIGLKNWFVYDDESINFLISMEDYLENVESDIRIKNNIIYFQDKLPYIMITNKDCKSFIINIYIEKDCKMKFECTLNMTPRDLMKKINNKLSNFKQDLCFDVTYKIFKVNSQSDYILDIDEPFGIFYYINECIKEEKQPEYILIDNPFSAGKRRSSSQVDTDRSVRINMIGKPLFMNKIPINENKAPVKVKKRESIIQRFSIKEAIMNLAYHDSENQKKNYEEDNDMSIINGLYNFEKFIEETYDDRPYKTTHNEYKSEISDDEEDLVRVNGKRNRSKAFSSSKKENFYKNDFSSSENKVIIRTEEEFNFSYDNLISNLTENINLKSIHRKFLINIHEFNLGKEFLSSMKKHLPNDKNIKFQLQAKLFSGNKSISKTVELNFNCNITQLKFTIRKNFDFGIKYSDLPLYSSLIFKLKTLIKEKKTVISKTIAWVNFRLFDHLKYLNTGIHKKSFWNTNFLDDSYFLYIDNFQENVGSIYFELESFMRPVEYILETPDLKNFSITISNNLSDDVQRIVQKITGKTLFESLSEEEEQILWNNRFSLSQNVDIIPRLLSVNCRTEKDLQLLIKMLKPVSPIHAMQLLSGNFLDETIRRFAVNSLQQVSYHEIMNYLLQLVQCLKYEVYHDSCLARFLLKLSIKHPLTIGHQFFWNLKSDMYNVNFQQRFGLYLNIFLKRVHPSIRNIFENEDWLVKNLIEVCDIAFKKGVDINSKLYEHLNKVNNDFKYRDVSIPFNYKLKVKSIKPEKCKFMRSKKRPLWIVFENCDPIGEDIYVIFKKGDDLRQDIITLQLFKSMRQLWMNNSLKSKMSLYNVISTGYFMGIVEIVKNSDTLAAIQKEFSGILAGFSSKPLKLWMEKYIKIKEDEYISNFLKSCAAYCIGTFVLGIGDRHNDNIMIKKNGELFHIDFGHILGHFKYKFGIKRERAPFVFTNEFLSILGGETSENFLKFKELCLSYYRTLRKNSDILITILNMMLCTGIPELTANSIKFLEYSLAIYKNESEAEKFIMDKLDEALNSLSTKLNFAIHILANK